MAFGNNGKNGKVTESTSVEITARFNNHDEVGHVRRGAHDGRPLRRRREPTMSHLGEPHHLHAPRRPPLGTRPHGVVLQVHVVHEERHCTLVFRGALVSETQLTVRSVEAMVHVEGDVIFNLSNVNLIDEIGLNALHYLIRSIQKQNGITRFR